MAAYGALVSLMNDLDLIPNHPTHSFSFDSKQIASLSQTVNFLIDFMDNYDSQVLESGIASAALAAHDVIESHVVDQIHAGSTLVKRKSRSYFLLDLQKAIDSMDVVKREAICCKAKSGLKATYSAAPASSEPPSSEKKNVMVGFDAAVVRLMAMLTGEPSAQRLIPIAGMGGLGKTTLARNVFEHLIIHHHFDVRLWSTISQKYSVENILNELLSGNSRNGSELGVQLHQMLWGRRYLIVLDDVWSLQAWDEIQRFLPDNGNGSCVIVTTRLSNLAARLSSSPFEMDFLEGDRSWELFCGKTFGEEGCPIELEEIGKKIVKRCRGLPLSIVVIGGHLKRSSRAIEYWEKVANFINPISSLVEDDEQCLKIISLSYEHLPACLKPCFLYLGMFEEDERIDAAQLFQFWIAEGFVKGKNGVSLEVVAEDYLKDLIERNLILVRKRRWNGKVEYFGIHDTVRELCLKVGEQEKFFGVFDLRLPRLFNPYYGKMIWPSRGCVNLRYLSFRYFAAGLCYPYPNSNHNNLSMSLFWNAQAIVTNTEISVPYKIWEMTQLRHLEFFGAELADPLPSVIDDQEKCIVLEKLHTLLGIRNLRLTEEVCKRMPNIKNMKLSYSDRPRDCEASSSSSYYCPHNLGRLNKLESLECWFGDDYKWRDVVRSIVLPTSLEELSLEKCHWKDLGKMMKSLPRLGSLTLQGIRGPEWDLAKEELEFPSLKRLIIHRCDDLINWIANSSHFPVLEVLFISYSPKLSEIPFDFGEIPTLGRIRLYYECSVSAAVSAMRIVVEQESCGNENLLLQVEFQKIKEFERFQTMVQQECLTTNNLHLSLDGRKIDLFR